MLGGELARERLDAEPCVEERIQRVRAERELAGAEAARIVEHERVLSEREAHPRVARRLGRVEQQRPGHA